MLGDPFKNGIILHLGEGPQSFNIEKEELEIGDIIIIKDLVNRGVDLEIEEDLEEDLDLEEIDIIKQIKYERIYYLL